MIKPPIALAVVIALLGPVGAAVAETETNDAQFQAAWQAAEAARQRAAELGHEWRDTEQQLEDAKALADAGDYEQAMRLVGHAKMEGERAAEQAELQATLWREAVPQ